MIKLKPIVPKRPILDPRRMEQAVDDGMRQAADEAIQDFEATVATWQHEVEFVAKKQKDGYLIGTKDAVWGMLDKGTRPHIIVPRRAKALRFPGGPYSPKTRPGFIGSQSGGSSGAIIIRPKVMHPGTDPRGWSKIIKKKWQSRLAQIVQQQINKALR